MPRSDRVIRDRLEALQCEARSHPRLHALRLFLVVAMGYTYPFLLLGAIFAVIVAALWPARLIWEEADDVRVYIVYLAALVGLLAVAVAVMRAMWPEIPRPTGHELGPTDAQPLREMIEQLRREAGWPRVDHIFVDTDLNAAVTQRPKFGFWGPRTNYLFLGVPLLIALSGDELRAVLAHEFGHLRGRHASFSAWVYRVHQTWATLAAPFKKDSWIRRAVMGWFVRRYSQTLALNTLPLRRLHEYEADRIAAERVGHDLMARTLLKLNWTGYRLERSFWPTLRSMASTEPLPPGDAMGRLAATLAGDPPRDLLERWRGRQTRCRSPITDEHPCLADRLAALDARELLDREIPRVTAAADSALALLGDCHARVVAIVNASWKVKVIAPWRAEHAMAKHLAEKQKSPSAHWVSTSDPEWEQLELKARAAAPDEAIALVHQFVQAAPDHPAANYQLGRMLLEEDDEAQAAQHLEAAMRSGSDYIGPSLHLLLDYYRDAGRDAEADPVRARLDEHTRALEQARHERQKVSRRDRFAPHALPAADIEKLRRILFRYPQVHMAHLVRKQVRLFSDKPSYVLAVVRHGRTLDDGGSADGRLINCLQGDLPLPCAVVVLGWTSPRLRSRILAASAEPVFIGND